MNKFKMVLIVVSICAVSWYSINDFYSRYSESCRLNQEMHTEKVQDLLSEARDEIKLAGTTPDEADKHLAKAIIFYKAARDASYNLNDSSVFSADELQDAIDINTELLKAKTTADVKKFSDAYSKLNAYLSNFTNKVSKETSKR